MLRRFGRRSHPFAGLSDGALFQVGQHVTDQHGIGPSDLGGGDGALINQGKNGFRVNFQQFGGANHIGGGRLGAEAADVPMFALGGRKCMAWHGVIQEKARGGRALWVLRE